MDWAKRCSPFDSSSNANIPSVSEVGKRRRDWRWDSNWDKEEEEEDEEDAEDEDNA